MTYLRFKGGDFVKGVNAYLIQETIRQKEYVTVPWVQRTYGLDYKDAVNFITLLQRRGWVESTPRGIRHPVKKGCFFLRKIARNEVDGLIEDITLDCVAALTCIQKKVAGVQGVSDTEEAVKILNEHNLIYLVNDLYFVTVSQETVSVLSQVVNRKRRMEANRRMSGKSDSNGVLIHLFDVLFEGE